MRPLLRGVAVVEVGEGAGLRLCGKLLADAGASVTHVDLAGTGRTSRASEPFVDGVKRSITLDPGQRPIAPRSSSCWATPACT